MVSFSFAVHKEHEMEIGYPTDVKHVAHIGLGTSDTSPSWVNIPILDSLFIRWSTTALWFMNVFCLWVLLHILVFLIIGNVHFSLSDERIHRNRRFINRFSEHNNCTIKADFLGLFRYLMSSHLSMFILQK